MPEIKPARGFGDVAFGMPADEVRRLLGTPLAYEKEMGGDPHDSLYYPGVVISFDQGGDDGPPPTARVTDIRVAEGSGATLGGVPALGPMTDALCRQIQNCCPDALWPNVGYGGYIELKPLCMFIGIDPSGVVGYVDMYNPGLLPPAKKKRAWW